MFHALAFLFCIACVRLKIAWQFIKEKAIMTNFAIETLTTLLAKWKLWYFPSYLELPSSFFFFNLDLCDRCVVLGRLSHWKTVTLNWLHRQLILTNMLWPRLQWDNCNLLEGDSPTHLRKVLILSTYPPPHVSYQL